MWQKIVPSASPMTSRLSDNIFLKSIKNIFLCVLQNRSDCKSKRIFEIVTFLFKLMFFQLSLSWPLRVWAFWRKAILWLLFSGSFYSNGHKIVKNWRIWNRFSVMHYRCIGLFAHITILCIRHSVTVYIHAFTSVKLLLTPSVVWETFYAFIKPLLLHLKVYLFAHLLLSYWMPFSPSLNCYFFHFWR